MIPKTDTSSLSELHEPERLCLWCNHFNLDVGSPGYSEYTPDSDFTMDCGKGRWRYKGANGTESDYRSCILSGTLCPDYSFNPELVNIKPAIKVRK